MQYTISTCTVCSLSHVPVKVFCNTSFCLCSTRWNWFNKQGKTNNWCVLSTSNGERIEEDCRRTMQQVHSRRVSFYREIVLLKMALQKMHDILVCFWIPIEWFVHACSTCHTISYDNTYTDHTTTVIWCILDIRKYLRPSNLVCCNAFKCFRLVWL